MNKIDLTNPQILEELWEGSTFDKSVYQLLERYTKALEDDQLESKSLEIQRLKQDIYFHLTTTRNRNLISEKQQQTLRNAVGCFFGLSTGSHAVTTWIMESRAVCVKIVDPDIVSPTNLNRMLYGWNEIGSKKITAASKNIKRISPYTEIIKTTKTDNQTQQDYFTRAPRPKFIVEAIDDLSSKYKLRVLAKKYKIPLIMATDVGDNVFIDIERYDLSPQPRFFNGRISAGEYDFDNLTPKERINLAMKIVGFEHNSYEMLDSLLHIGKKIGTWPQLAATASIAGGATVTAIKKILLGEKVNSGRYYISLDKILVEDFDSKNNKLKRAKAVKAIKKRFS